MTRTILSLMACLLMSTLVHADGNLETAQKALAKAQKSYVKEKDRAKDNLREDITKVLKSQRADNTGNELEHLARVQELEADLRAFVTYDQSPSSSLLQDEVKTYELALQVAREKCEKAFHDLSQVYSTADDKPNAELVQTQMQAYFKNRSRTFQPGRFLLKHDPPAGIAHLVLLNDGTFEETQESTVKGTWVQSGDELLLTFTDTNYGIVDLKIEDNDHLCGPNVHKNGRKWNWIVLRNSSTTLKKVATAGQ